MTTADVWDTADVAHYLLISVRTVSRRLMSRRKGAQFIIPAPAGYVSGNPWWQRSEIEAWAAEFGKGGRPYMLPADMRVSPKPRRPR